MDVVYNHVYQFDLQAFQKIRKQVISFRYDQAGNLSNGTGSATIPSERYMMRRYIRIPSFTGHEFTSFRFDLMGFMTLKPCWPKCQVLNKLIRPLVVLGEVGIWNHVAL